MVEQEKFKPHGLRRYTSTSAIAKVLMHKELYLPSNGLRTISVNAKMSCERLSSNRKPVIHSAIMENAIFDVPCFLSLVFVYLTEYLLIPSK